MSTQQSAYISLDHLLKNAQDGVFALDHQRRFVVFNEVCERITGHNGRNLINHECTCADLLYCQDDYDRSLSGVLCPARAIFNNNLDSARQRMQIRRPDGSTTWVETIYSAVRNQDGQVELVLGIIRDVNDSKAKEDELLKAMAELRGQMRQLRESQSSQQDSEHRKDNACPDQSQLQKTPPANQQNDLNTHLQLDPYLQRAERQAILQALRAANWQRNKAAKLMGISRSRLYRRMESLRIDLKKRS